MTLFKVRKVGEPKAGKKNYRDPEPIKEIHKNDSKEPGARPFSEGAGAESKELVIKRYRHPNTDCKCVLWN